VDYSKLDASLGQAIESGKSMERFLVFLRVDPDAHVDSGLLDSLSIKREPKQKTITATLSRDQIDTLSERPWVKSLKLSHEVRKLDSSH
jgi:hypothetical protein